MKATVPAVLCFVVSIMTMAIAIIDGDAVAGCLDFTVMVTSAFVIVTAKRWEYSPHLLLIVAIACLVGTGILLLLPGWSSDMGISESVYSHVEGIVGWIMSFPVAFLILTVFVNVSGASFNRIMTFGITAFISIGIMTLTWMFISVACGPQLDVRFTFAQELSYLFINALLSFVVAVALCIKTRKNGFRLERKGVED